MATYGVQVDANGFTGLMSFIVDPSGSLRGDMFGDPIAGSYQGDKISFVRTNGSDPAFFQAYAGNTNLVRSPDRTDSLLLFYGFFYADEAAGGRAGGQMFQWSGWMNIPG
jgi:hypothetical protein